MGRASTTTVIWEILKTRRLKNKPAHYHSEWSEESRSENAALARFDFLFHLVRGRLRLLGITFAIICDNFFSSPLAQLHGPEAGMQAWGKWNGNWE